VVVMDVRMMASEQHRANSLPVQKRECQPGDARHATRVRPFGDCRRRDRDGYGLDLY